VGQKTKWDRSSYTDYPRSAGHDHRRGIQAGSGGLICGKKGMKTLKRHLYSAHNLKPGQYSNRLNVPKDQPLSATGLCCKNTSSCYRQGTGAKSAAARAAKKANKKRETRE